MDKTRVRHHFAAAAHSYDAHAVIQRAVAQRLADAIAARWPTLGEVIEVGCGTGNLTRALLRTDAAARIVATDLAPAMLDVCARQLGAEARGRVRYAVADGETLQAPAGALVASSLAFQWFDDPLAAVRRLHAQGARVAVATLVDGTFDVWRQAHARLGLEDGVLPLLDEPAWRAQAQALGAQVTFDTLSQPFDDPLDFVRALKGIGAGTPRPGHRPVPLARVLRQFPQGLVARYRVAYWLSAPPESAA
ncbi:methyltransferase domain-containing protein [Aquabacterium sp.]|uniref:methyltransferase domain-containing protein n=1 Tax=Aquabacterium sp. TaxID=1872578 RepID=UPI0035B3992C